VAAYQFAPPQKIQSAKLHWKSSGLKFLGSRRHPLHYLPKGQAINMEYYPSKLVLLKGILKKKYRWKVTKWVLFLHDNAPAHRAFTSQKKLALPGLPFS